MKKLFFYALTIAAFIFAGNAYANEEGDGGFSFGAGCDIVSAYNWRSNDYGNSPAIQPYVSVSGYNFEFLLWNSQALIKNSEHAGKEASFNEIDMVLKYFIPLGENGKLALSCTDFFYPYTQKSFFNWKDFKSGSKAGAHYLNTGVEYIGPKDFPIKIASDVAIFNDQDKPWYTEVSYAFEHKGFTITPVLGMVKHVGNPSVNRDQGWHTYFLDLDDGTGKKFKFNNQRFSFVNAGFTIAKTIKITNDFSLPVAGQIAINPYTEKAYFIFKMSL